MVFNRHSSYCNWIHSFVCDLYLLWIGGNKMSMQYIRDAYNVPAKRGKKVIVDIDIVNINGNNGFRGVIVGSKGGYLRIRVRGKIGTYHLTSNVIYVD